MHFILLLVAALATTTAASTDYSRPTDSTSPADQHNALEYATPSECLDANKPCPSMEVRRFCNGPPTDVDPWAKYTFEFVRFTVDGCRLTFGVNYTDATGRPATKSGDALTDVSEWLVYPCCKAPSVTSAIAPLWRWVPGAAWGLLCSYVVARLVWCLPLGLHRWIVTALVVSRAYGYFSIGSLLERWIPGRD